MKQLLFATSLLAISQAFAIVNVGPKVGVGMSNIIGDKTDDYTFKSSYSVGVMARLGLLVLDLQAEILYTSKGSTIKATDNQSETNFNLNYLEIPLIVRMPVLPMIGVYGGVSLNTLLTAESEDGGNTTDIKDRTNDVETAIVLGGDFTLLETISLDIRYSHGLTTINSSDSSPRVINQNISLMAGYMF